MSKEVKPIGTGVNLVLTMDEWREIQDYQLSKGELIMAKNWHARQAMDLYLKMIRDENSV